MIITIVAKCERTNDKDSDSRNNSDNKDFN